MRLLYSHRWGWTQPDGGSSPLPGGLFAVPPGRFQVVYVWQPLGLPSVCGLGLAPPPRTVPFKVPVVGLVVCSAPAWEQWHREEGLPLGHLLPILCAARPPGRAVQEPHIFLLPQTCFVSAWLGSLHKRCREGLPQPRGCRSLVSLPVSSPGRSC